MPGTSHWPRDSAVPGSLAGELCMYEPQCVIGCGSFGVVIRAKVRDTGKTVAIKRVLIDPRFQPRELVLLRDNLYSSRRRRNTLTASMASHRHCCGDGRSDMGNSGDGTMTNDEADLAGSVGGTTHSSTNASRHPCIVELLDYFCAAGTDRERYLYMVMDHLPLDVRRLQHRYVRELRQRMPLILVRIIMFQLARALTFLHHREICHRDVKPGNVLIDPETGVVKLCDFGSAKVMQPVSAHGPREKNVAYICSRYYRAPELLFGSLYYHCSIDMWSFGCVLVELLCGDIFFKGESTVDQMTEIIKVLGEPTEQELFAMNPQSATALLSTRGPAFSTSSFSNHSTPSNDYLQRYHALRIKSAQWQSILPPGTPQSAIALIGQLLRYTPKERLPAAEVLEHEFFDELFAEDARLPNGAPLPASMFHPSEDESVLLPSWLLARMTAAMENSVRMNEQGRNPLRCTELAK
ncbi:Protein kinase domain [Trypanosoma vivax]|nr:putative glycogen synthase kinase-3 alpha [Trypanosoma vivax]KAH8618743.1 Protein kinase domain [Trypanosoma vivax]